MSPDNRITLEVVINGTPYPLPFSVHERLHAVVSSALAHTGNTGRPPSDWIVKDEAGRVLDQARSLADLGLHEGSRIFLSLHSGVGGEA